MSSQSNADIDLTTLIQAVSEGLNDDLPPLPSGSSYTEIYAEAERRYPEINPNIYEAVEKIAPMRFGNDLTMRSPTLDDLQLTSSPCLRCPLANWRRTGLGKDDPRAGMLQCICNGSSNPGETVYSVKLNARMESTLNIQNSMPYTCTEYLRSCQVWPPKIEKKLDINQVLREAKARANVEQEESKNRKI